MDDQPAQPLVFSHKVIKQFVDHLVGEVELERNDYAIIRLLFRKAGGSWEAIFQGDPKQLESLKSVVLHWGQNFAKEVHEDPKGLV